MMFSDGVWPQCRVGDSMKSQSFSKLQISSNFAIWVKFFSRMGRKKF